MKNLISTGFLVGVSFVLPPSVLGIMGYVDPRLGAVVLSVFSLGMILIVLSFLSLFFMCLEEVNKSAVISGQKRVAKDFIDANVWDGDDRSGCSSDSATFNPDELQELVDEFIEHLNR